MLKCDSWDWRIKTKSALCSSCTVKKEVFLLEAGDLAFRMKPVSYTHLDVYKRQGILRVGGRLQQSQLNYNSKHQIILTLRLTLLD